MPRKNRTALFLFIFTLSSTVWAKTLSELNLEDFETTSQATMEWSKNPFVQPVGEVDISQMQLTAIVYAKGDAAALVNGETVRVGDRIGFSKITEIESNRVILRNDNGIFFLTLKKNNEKSETP